MSEQPTCPCCGSRDVRPHLPRYEGEEKSHNCRACHCEWNESRRTPPAPSAAVPVEMPVSVDELAQFIRQIDGSHSMGAGRLAERIHDWISEELAQLRAEDGKG